MKLSTNPSTIYRKNTKMNTRDMNNRRRFVPFGEAKNTLVSVYEIPPKKAAYPYNFHHNNEETFYIISGEGILDRKSVV